jgi:DNA-binding NtrC family response regulator
MHRILLLDADHSQRTALADNLRRTADTEIVLADDAATVVAKVTEDSFAAVFADAELLGDEVAMVIASIARTATRPLLVIASSVQQETLDPDFVSLVVRKPYDVRMVTGILLSAVLQPPPLAGGSDGPGKQAQ